MFHFYAYIARMKLIQRWSLMRCTQTENVQEHSLQVAVTAHSLALIKNKYFGGNISPERVALLAIFHDASEVVTGDLPTPVKYFSREIRDAYKSMEKHAVDQLIKLLPEDLKPDYHSLLHVHDAELELHQLIKSADVICAYIKCIEEVAAGNNEFVRAQKTISEKLESLRKSPEVDYFLKNFVPSFQLSLDEISRSLN